MILLYETDHYGVPLAGLARLDGELVHFRVATEYMADRNGLPLNDSEARQRMMEERQLMDYMREHDLWDDEDMHEQVERVEVHNDYTYIVYELSFWQKCWHLFDKKKFEFFVGTHWSHDRHRGPNRFNRDRWFGLGKLLFKIYFRKSKDAKDRGDCPAGRPIAQVPLSAFVFPKDLEDQQQ